MRHVPRAAVLPVVLGLTLVGAGLAVGTQNTRHHGAIHTPGELEWREGPPSLPPGAEFVVLEGDPSRAEYFAMRLRLPDGYRIPPHWHPVHERVTVIAGTFHLGQGDRFHDGATEALEAGSYFSMAPEMRHYARAEGDTTIQLTSIGPWEIRYVNAADDPRRQQTAR